MSSDLHDCPKVGCPERLPFEVLACKQHWFELPAGLRFGIGATWRNGNMAKYMELREEAVAILNGMTE